MSKHKKIPLRICLGCREKIPKKDLVRLVRTPDNEVVLDMTGKKPGRGAYLCPREECFKKAVKGKRLERNLQQPISSRLTADLAQVIKNKESE